MNIDDTHLELEDFEDENIISQIFEHQSALMEKYDQIEAGNNCSIIVAPPYNLDDCRVQARIKDMFWRMTEELCEAHETFTPPYDWRNRWETDFVLRHYFEELADALHFLTEASILANFKANDGMTSWISWHEDHTIMKTAHDCSTRIFEVVYNAGLAANTLKNKPWKNSQMSTDKPNFYRNLSQTWKKILTLFADLGMNPTDVLKLYLKKNQVNQFRQRSNY